MRFSVFGNYIKFLLNEYQHMHLVSFKITYWIATMLQSNGLHIVIIPEMCTLSSMHCHVLDNSYFSPISLSSWNLKSVQMNANSISELTKITYLSYFHYLNVFYLIISCSYQSVFKGEFLWYCGNTDEKLRNIFKVKSTKILRGGSWAPFSIVLIWVLTVYSNKLQDLKNIGDQLKMHSHLPSS